MNTAEFEDSVEEIVNIADKPKHIKTSFTHPSHANHSLLNGITLSPYGEDSVPYRANRLSSYYLN